jgi:hypothetical protein
MEGSTQLPLELADKIKHPYFRDMYLRFAQSGDSCAAEKFQGALCTDVNAWFGFVLLLRLPFSNTLHKGCLFSAASHDLHSCFVHGNVIWVVVG